MGMDGGEGEAVERTFPTHSLFSQIFIVSRISLLGQT